MADKKNELDLKAVYNVKRLKDDYVQQMSGDQLFQKRKDKDFDKKYEELGAVKNLTKAQEKAQADTMAKAKIEDAEADVEKAQAKVKELKDAEADKEEIDLAKSDLKKAKAVLKDLK